MTVSASLQSLMCVLRHNHCTGKPKFASNSCRRRRKCIGAMPENLGLVQFCDASETLIFYLLYCGFILS